MHLINNIYFVLTYLWWNSNLINQVAYIVHMIVGCRVEFKNVKGKITLFGLPFLCINDLCKNSCTSGFTYATGASEQKGLGQLVLCDLMHQGFSHVRLPHDFFESIWPIFPGRNHKLLHVTNVMCFKL